MTYSGNASKAKALAELGLYVFPVTVSDNPENPYKKLKRPSIPNAHKDDGVTCRGECGRLGHGFYDATNDPFYAVDLFEKYPNAHVGVWTGKSGIISHDVDVKLSPDGEVLIDGWESFEREWLDFPATFVFDSVSGAGGRQFIFADPGGINLPRKSDYRKMKGVDRQSGDSYIVWNGDVPASRDVFAPAPEWLLDTSEVRSAETFQGTLKDWYEGLVPGEPSAIVKRAMERAKELYASLGNDLSHSDMVELQHNAVRLGAEGNSGVPELLQLLEDLAVSREGAHSRNPDEYAHEFHEALSSGIQKYGAAIDLLKSIPDYSPAIVPDEIPDSWVSSEAPGGKTEFNRLLRRLVEVTEDDMLALSILWNAPTTRDLARDWGGVEFILKRIQEQRQKSQAPATATAPTSTVERSVKATAPDGYINLLNSVEEEQIEGKKTFIDTYLAANESAVGFVQPAYAVPMAWTCLSMAFGRKAYIPYAGSMEMNLWFNILGHSGSGKSVTFDFAFKQVLPTIFNLYDETPYFRVKGSGSSPEGWDEVLLKRDDLPTVMADDEAAEFYKSLLSRDWMGGIPNKLSDWYMGDVLAPSKIRLAELKGKRAKTSFNFLTIATPEDVLRAVTDDFFKNGFMARMAWVEGPPPTDSDERYLATRSEVNAEKGVSESALSLSLDLTHARGAFGERVEVWGDDDAVKRLERAYKEMDRSTRYHPRYRDVIQPSVVRLNQTMWKVAGLLALYRGDTQFTLTEALIALKYGTEWLNTIISISDKVAGVFQRDLNLIVDYIRDKGGRVSRKAVLTHFTGMIVKSGREINERLDYLLDSGRLQTVNDKGTTYYEVTE